MKDKITLEQALTYEILSSWWVGWFPFLIDVGANYYAWKVKRRYRAYEKAIKKYQAYSKTVK